MIRVIGIFLGLVWIAGPASAFFIYKCEAEFAKVKGQEVLGSYEYELSVHPDRLVLIYKDQRPYTMYVDWVDRNNQDHFVFSGAGVWLIKRPDDAKDMNPSEFISLKSKFQIIQSSILDDEQIWFKRHSCSI